MKKDLFDIYVIETFIVENNNRMLENAKYVKILSIKQADENTNMCFNK